MAHIDIHGIKAYYREWGSAEGAAILILHGWGVDSSQYETLGSMLAKNDCRVIVPDLPGFGNTPVPKKAWEVGEYAEWVQEFAQKLGLDRFVLFGHSFGGRIAIKYTAKYPGQLRALILCASAGIKPPLTFKRVILYVAAKIGRAIFKPPGLSFAAEILKRILYRLAGVTDYLKARGIMKEVLKKTIKEDLTSILPSLEVPTLLLWGAADQATPYKDGQTMARLIPNAKLVTFDGERHNLPKHIPEKLAVEITTFLNAPPSIPRN